MEPCLYMKYDAKGELVGMIIVHVDDFQIAGADWSEDYKAEVDNLKTLYKWGAEWKSDADGYVCCGVGVSSHEGGGFHLEQEKYAAGMEQVPIGKANPGDEIGPNIVAQCRAVIGQCHWLAANTMPWLSGMVSICQSRLIEENVKAVQTLSQVVRMIKQQAGFGMNLHSLKNPTFVTYHDASWCVRTDLSSQGCFLT